jgi:hypothetical protein
MNSTEAIWDGMSRLLEKIKAYSEDMDWPELLSMVMTQVMDGINEETPDNKLFNQESYLMRLCIRYEHFKKSPFNIVSIDHRNERFRIANYDYKTYLWAKKVYDMEIDNNFIYIPFTKLSEKQIKAFKEKAVNNYEDEDGAS